MKKPLGGTALRKAADERKRAFAEHVASGRNGTEAARLAGYTGTDASLGATASRLLKIDSVQAWIAAAVEKASTKRILTAVERRELLTEWATQASEPAELRDRISAVKELNAMDGLHIKKLEHAGPNGQPILAVLATVPTETLRERLAELVARKPKEAKK